MKENMTETANRAKLTASITRNPLKLDGLSVSLDQSFTVEFSPFGPMEVKKALTDSEMITSLLREYPTEMASIINDTFAGRMEAAKATALKIGLTEEAFQEAGGGMLFWIGIAFCAGVIGTCAAFGC
ncbi:hypothetical protein [Methyloglobulus sp.]|jgi:hypothetical protein|uniref:hypothetical protein n=1 Tax=Methyloglobulus sp. TaxID=2518622 RepID=UPI0032B77D0B